MKNLIYVLNFLMITIFVSCGSTTSKLTKRVRKISSSNSYKQMSERLYLARNVENNDAYNDCSKGRISDGLEKLYNNHLEQKMNPKYFNQIGSCYFMAKNFSMANFYFHKAWGLSKFRFLPAYYNLGLISLQIRDFDKAEKIFTEVVKKDSRNFLGHFGLYEIAKFFGNHKLALSYLGSYERTLPRDLNGETRRNRLAEIHFSRGVLYFELREFPKALSSFNRVEKNTIREFDKDNLFPKTLVQLGRTKDAMDYLGVNDMSGLNAYKLSAR